MQTAELVGRTIVLFCVGFFLFDDLAYLLSRHRKTVVISIVMVPFFGVCPWWLAFHQRTDACPLLSCKLRFLNAVLYCWLRTTRGAD
jgi:hypothetical protein